MAVRKRFGQHFLHDPAVIRRIIDAVAPVSGEHIVEVGPGLQPARVPERRRERVSRGPDAPADRGLDDRAAQGEVGHQAIDLPVLNGSIGPKVIDVRSLYAKTGMFTYDPGFMATAACRSSITYIDGDQGILMYRGYPIQELAAKSDFLEVAYLLLNGELPTKAQLDAFVNEVRMHTFVHENLKKFQEGFRHDANPMAMFISPMPMPASLMELARYCCN